MSKAETAQKENAIVKYLRETRAELRKVTWPTAEEVRNLGAIVLAVSAAMAVFLWLLDLGFSALIGVIVGL